jgi:uncharacterized membrane protein YsdA (DUF1294 family)
VQIQSLLVPFLVISLAAAIVTIYDKRCAKSNSWRVPEKVLILLSLLGGSVAMLVVMNLIHHKTRHLKFMLGIPVIIILQCAAIYFAFRVGILKF